MRLFHHLLIAALAATCLAANSALADPSPGVGTPGPGASNPPPTGPVKHALYGTWMDSGYNSNSLVAGFNPIDSTTVTCANAAGCTILLEIMAEAGFNSTAGNSWAIVGMVDGNFVDNGPYQGILPTTGAYVTGNWRGSYAVAKGTHTVSFQLYVTEATLGASGTWQATYAVYKP